MNDFTKDELEFLWATLSCCYPPWDIPDNVKNEFGSCMKKLQCMVENYCEHKPSDEHHENFRWQLCSKCGAEYTIR